MVNFVMNDKCAAGTGRFLDVMASILRLDVDDLDTEAAKATAPASISSTCTVFAESEVISQLANGGQAARSGGGHLPQRGQPRGGPGPAGGCDGAGLPLRRRGPGTTPSVRR